MLFRRLRSGRVALRVALPGAIGAVLAIGCWLVAACANDGGGAGPGPTGFDAALESGASDAAIDVYCGPQRTLCGSTCVFTPRDPANCGQCGLACSAGQVCSSGICAKECIVLGEVMCGGDAAVACTNLEVDPDNCGTCGARCALGLTCIHGICDCVPGSGMCSGVCVDLNWDDNNCGACGNGCSNGLTCFHGTCMSCGDAGSTLCPAPDAGLMAYCADTRNSPQNCGGCGLVCDGGNVCFQGQCGCGPLLTACAGACVNTRFDRNNCGACGNACDGGSCVDGGCKP